MYYDRFASIIQTCAGCVFFLVDHIRNVGRLLDVLTRALNFNHGPDNLEVYFTVLFYYYYIGNSYLRI